MRLSRIQLGLVGHINQARDNLAQATEVLFLEIDNSLCNIYGLNEARRRVLESYVVLIMTYRYEL